MTDHKYFTVETTSLTLRKSGSLAIYCGDSPRRNADGSTNHSLRAPMAIIPPELFDEEEEMATTIGEVLNENAHRFYKSARRSTAIMTPQQLLDAVENFGITPDSASPANSVLLAGAFAAQAFEKMAAHAITRDSAPMELARTFLLALIDPLHPDLDYLRADPASGAVERAKREDAAHG